MNSGQNDSVRGVHRHVPETVVLCTSQPLVSFTEDLEEEAV